MIFILSLWADGGVYVGPREGFSFFSFLNFFFFTFCAIKLGDRITDLGCCELTLPKKYILTILQHFLVYSANSAFLRAHYLK